MSALEKPFDSASLEQASTVLEERPVTVVARSMHPSAERPVAAVDADEFRTRYELGQLLGEGGMGEVRLCNDARIGREVAMKVVRAGQGSRSDLRARFLREVQVQGQLEHPSIVPVYDLGVGPHGATYFTMKRVRGLTLAEILALLATENAPALRDYSLRKLLAAFGSVCLAIEFAHARKVIHRDLKPSNIMLGDFGEVYVLDWGIAKISGEPHEEAPSGSALREDMKTAVGSFIGTLGYLSPEQFEGLELDGRSDVYALGAILFELLTLTPLHRGSPAQIVVTTMSPVDARCSERAPSREIPPELEQICVTATSLDPKDRYATARLLYDAIQRYLDGDRDAEQRRLLSTKHTDAAMAALDNGSSSANKATALLELGRSLALDPGNEKALGAIVGLLVEPPSEVPAEVIAEIELSHVERVKTISREGMIAFLGGPCMFLPLLVWMGVKNWTWTLAFVLAMVVASVLCYFQARKPRERDSVIILILAALGFMAFSRFLGTFILIPSMTLGTAVVYSTNPSKRLQRLGLAAMGLTLLVPLLLESLGVLPRSYVFHDGVMMVVSQLAVLSERETTIVLLCTTLFPLLTAWSSVQSVVAALKEAEESLYLQAWQLRQLVPARARQRVTQRQA